MEEDLPHNAIIIKELLKSMVCCAVSTNQVTGNARTRALLTPIVVCDDTQDESGWPNVAQVTGVVTFVSL